jgi:hypothetical protein
LAAFQVISIGRFWVITEAVLIALNLAPQLTSFTVRDCVREASGISVEYSECNLNGSRSQQ